MRILLKMTCSSNRLVLVFWTLVICIKQLTANSRMPLIGDDDDMPDRKTPGCRLGNSYYDLEETWNPILEPDGMMVCIICQCLPLIKKGVLQTKGKVTCRNIKDECPKPNCESPVLLPEQCCKTCPGEGPPLFKSFVDPRTLIPPPSFFNRGSLYPVAHQTYSPQDFMALMVGKSEVSSKKTRAVAAAYFSLYHSSLSYTLLYEKLAPRSVLFFNDKNHLLDEIAINRTNTDESEGKVCGTWYYLPSIYLKYLLNGKLHMAVKTDGEDAPHIGGQIIKYDKDDKGSLLSILTPRKKSGAGALAAMKLSSRGKILTFTVQSQGLLSKRDMENDIRVKFHLRKKGVASLRATLDDKSLVLSAQWRGLNKKVWKQLTMGKMQFSIDTDSGVLANGQIIPHLSCNIIQATLSSRGLGCKNKRDTMATPQGAGASAIIHVLRNGSVAYSVKQVGLTAAIDRISIGMTSRRSGKIRHICKSQSKHFPEDINGKITGRCKRVNARYLDMLLEGRLFFSIFTKDEHKTIQGRIFPISYDHLTSEDSVLLTGSELEPPVTSDGAAQVWFSLDSFCSLHYQIVVSGLEQPGNSSLNLYFVERSIPNQWDIKSFVGTSARGVLNNLDGDLYKGLDRGSVYLQIATESHQSGELAGKVVIKNDCHNPERINSLVLMDEPGNPRTPKPDQRHDCYVNGVWNKDGDSWVPGLGNCKTCSCKRGEIICHEIICPETSCPEPIQLPGECCLQCTEAKEQNSYEKCFFTGDKRFHYFGTLWHPYVPPFGYVKCALCECSADEDKEVSCRRLPCPPLPCPRKIAYRQSETDCCLTCPADWDDEVDNPPEPMIDMMLGDVDESQACMFGQYKYHHGDAWNPRIAPFGKMDCITCRCERGRTQCEREKCQILKCKNRHLQKVPGTCCPICRKARGHRNRFRHQFLSEGG